MAGLSRRAVLRAGLGAGVAGAAGCSRLRGERTAPPTGTLLDWIPSPDAFEGPAFLVRTQSLAAVRRHRDALHPATRKLLRRQRAWRRFRPLSTRLEGADRLLRAGPARVYLGVDPGGLESYLFDRRYEQVESYGGFAMYRKRPRGFELYPLPEVVGVGGDQGVVVTSVGLGGGAVRARKQVELVVDAKRGDVERFHATSERHAHAVRPLAGATVGLAAVPDVRAPLGGVAVHGRRWTLGPDVTRFEAALAFEDEDDAEVADLPGYARRVAPGHRDRGVERDGPLATVTSEISTGRFDVGFPGDPGADGIPDVTFAVEPLGDQERARVVHAGGQPVDAARLTVTVGGDRASTQFGDAWDRVTEGDGITVTAGGLTVVEVTWTAPGGDASYLVAKAAAR